MLLLSWFKFGGLFGGQKIALERVSPERSRLKLLLLPEGNPTFGQIVEDSSRTFCLQDSNEVQRIFLRYAPAPGGRGKFDPEHGIGREFDNFTFNSSVFFAMSDFFLLGDQNGVFEVRTAYRPGSRQVNV
jgi:hypothetical protein